MKILAVTPMLPTPSHPRAGTFIEQQIQGLRDIGLAVDTLLVDRASQGALSYLKTGSIVRKQLKISQPDVVHIMYGGVFAYFAVKACREYPTLVSFGGTELQGDDQGNLLFRIRINMSVWASHHTALMADGIIVKSEGLKQALPDDLINNQVWVIPNGVNLEMFRPLDREKCRAELGWDSSEYHILFSTNGSDISKRRQLAEAAIEALQRKGIHARMHGLPGIPHQEVPVWMNACDVLLLTSKFEGSPNIVKESLACNLPVVSVDVGDVRERIAGIDGCYLTSDNIDDIADKLEIVHTGTKRMESRVKMEELSLEKVALRLQDAYRTVIASFSEVN